MKSASALLCWAATLALAQQPSRPEIPKTWDRAALTSLEVPQPDPRYSPVAVPVEYYYRVPIRPIYKTYPVYAPGKEPSDYMEWLRKQEPQVTFEPARLVSENDWIKTGELVFHAPFGFDFAFTAADVRNTAWFEHIQPPLTEAGVMPFVTYVVRQKGKIELGTFACAMCHIRVLPNGTVIKGAQGNFPIDRVNAFSFRRTPVQLRHIYRTLSGAPWLKLYYKIPSLKGVWYRGPFEHNGSVATLEDWFDPKRLRPEYVPTGFKGYGVKTRAVKGHEFGLNLSDSDKTALIAYLRTL